MSGLTDSWREWIAANLLHGVAPSKIVDILTSKGFGEDVVEAELREAAAHPYFLAARSLAHRVKKREWVLEIYREMGRCRLGAGIQRRPPIPREEFLRDFYTQNVPVVIEGLLQDWPALLQWNVDYLRSRFGDCEVEVQAGRDAEEEYEIKSHLLKQRMSLRVFLDTIEGIGHSNNYYMTANNCAANNEFVSRLWQDVGDIPDYLDRTSPNRGFFWLGPAGAVTPMHHDLTHNLMAQILGRKRVKLVSPADLAYMYNHRHCFTEVDPESAEQSGHPMFEGVNVHEVLLQPGDCLFLPVGWWHHVRSLDISISLTFSNFQFPNDFYSSYQTYGAM